MKHRNVYFKKLNGNDLATLYKTLVNFGPVTPEFTRGKGYTPLVDQQFSYVRLAAPLLDTAVISTQFSHLFARGRHCYAARATRYALLRISSYMKYYPFSQTFSNTTGVKHWLTFSGPPCIR